MSSADGPDPRLGGPDAPLRVAVIGSGPAGFYAVQALFQQQQFSVRVDMYDRLPMPFGLVRSGVAPDHQKIKSVAALYDKLASRPEFRFFGNVEYGRDITLEELQERYHQIVFASGAQADRALQIPGEDLEGVHSARHFVAWYNGDPDYAHQHFDFTAKSAVVVGVGNVAADVARILCRVPENLEHTDIADHALKDLRASSVKTVYVLGRRGPIQSSFSTPEIKELGELLDAEASIPAADLELDPESAADLEAGPGSERRKYEALLALRDRSEPAKSRKLILRFLVSPVEILGDDQGRVRAVKMVRNELYRDERGSLRPRATDQFETIKAGLVFRSVGYRGVSLPGLPFDRSRGTVPNDQGRVTHEHDGDPVTAVYVTGWIKRGPSGLIGANKGCAKETVEHMMEDASADAVFHPSHPEPEAIERLLEERGVPYVTYDDWRRIDAFELELGKRSGRPRVKLTELDQILRVAHPDE